LSDAFADVNIVVILSLKIWNLRSFQVKLVFTVVKVVLRDSEAAQVFIHWDRLARKRTIRLHAERLLRTFSNRILIECFLLERAIL
jgi:hypothetical protein